MSLCWWWTLPTFVCLRQSLVTFIHELYVHLVQKSVSEETECLFLPRNELASFPARLSCGLVSPFGLQLSPTWVCCFSNYFEWPRASHPLSRAPPLPWTSLRPGVPGDTSIPALLQLPGALNTAPLRGELLLLAAGSKACDGAGVTGSPCSSLRLKLRRSSVAEPQEEDFLSILSSPRANPWASFCVRGPAHTRQPTLLSAGAGGDPWRGEFPAPSLQQTPTFVASEQNPGHEGLLSPHLVAVHFCWCV